MHFGLNIDDPSFGLALLAILIALRVAMLVVERLLPARAVGVATPEATSGEVTLGDEAPPPLATDASVVPEDAIPPIDPAVEATPTVPPVIEAPERSRFFTELLDSAVIAVVLVFFLVRPFLLQAFFIPSGSMNPTLHVGDKLLATKYTFHLRNPHRGEVVVFQAPKVALDMLGAPYDPKRPTEYVKRVIGLPGDRIRIVAHTGVMVNGEYLAERYDKPNYDFPRVVDPYWGVEDPVSAQLKSHINANGELVIPEGYLLMLGDNRTQSHDSHIWGLLDRKALIGKAAFIFWPPSRIGFIH